MSIDLETRLRQDLAAAPVDIPIDVDRTLAAGRRAVTNQRVGWGIGAVAVVAAGSFLVPQLVPGRVPAIPAGPPTGQATAVFGAHGFGFGEGSVDLESATIQLRRDAGEALEVTATVTLEGQEPISDTMTVEDPSNSWTHRLSDLVMVGIAPPHRWIDWVDSGSETGRGEVSEVTGAPLDLTVHLLVRPKPSEWQVLGAVWQQPDGQVRNSRGESVSVVEFAGQDATVYVDPSFDRIGMHAQSGLGIAAVLSEVEAGHLAAVGAMGTTDYALYLLPADAAGEVEPTTLTPDAQAEVGTLKGGAWDGRMVVWTTRDNPAGTADPATAQLLGSVSYRDAAGQLITVRLKV